MPIRVVTGPPFAGKSQAVAKVRRPGDILLDTTLLWKAFRDPGYVERSDADGQLANAMMRKGLDVGVSQERNGWMIVAARDPIRLKKWMDAAGQQKAWMVTAPMATLRARARKRGPSCEDLLTEWDGYEDDPELAALTEQWSEDDMRTIHEVEIQYRAALEGLTVREAGSDVQHRCLTDHAELRAEGGNSRVVSGIAVRYGDEARLAGFRERIARGALKLPTRAANLTLQHDRSQPVGILEWVDNEDALGFRATLTKGSSLADEAFVRVEGGTLRGASLEMKLLKQRMIEKDETEWPLFEILEAQVVRLSLVDDGAYPQSGIRLRVDPMQSARRERTEESKFVHLGVQPARRPRGFMVV